MLEAIADLKNNRRKLVTDEASTNEHLVKAIRTLCEKRSRVIADPLRVPLKDLLAAEVNGSGEWRLLSDMEDAGGWSAQHGAVALSSPVQPSLRMTMMRLRRSQLKPRTPCTPATSIHD